MKTLILTISLLVLTHMPALAAGTRLVPYQQGNASFNALLP